jgi:hypothetical protein
MIRSYSFKNFYSFLEETEVSLLANKQVPDSNNLATLKDGQRVSKVMTVLGHNASGKTKLLMPLAFMSWFMSRSFQDIAPDALIPIEPHLASDSDVISCEVEFTLAHDKESTYRYELDLTKTQVNREALYVKDKRFKYVFIREWNEEKQQYQVKQQGFGFNPAEAKKVRKNASLIATAAQYGVAFLEEFTGFADRITTNVTVVGRRHLDKGALDESTLFYNKNPHFLEKLNTLIKRLDLGVESISIKTMTLPDSSEGLVPICSHQSKGKYFSLSLINESSGTRGAYSILRYILPVLEYGGIAVLDEMESELHPQMALEVMRLFTDSDSNPNNAQLLIATHSLEVLQRVEKNQIYLVEKNDCVSRVLRLDKVLGVRRDDNLYARYIAGSYGAIPRFS